MACFFGIGLVLERFSALNMIVLGVGSIAVIIIGIMLMRSKASASKTLDLDKPITGVIATCFVVTWLNPQAIIDGTLLLGGFKATLDNTSSALFISGVCISSAMWFLGISTIVSKFKDSFNDSLVKKINIVCGGIIVAFGVKLMFSFIKLF
jgi:L-lysine exporter family protein LysE/ArgO